MNHETLLGVPYLGSPHFPDWEPYYRSPDLVGIEGGAKRLSDIQLSFAYYACLNILLRLSSSLLTTFFCAESLSQESLDFASHQIELVRELYLESTMRGQLLRFSRQSAEALPLFDALAHLFTDETGLFRRALASLKSQVGTLPDLQKLGLRADAETLIEALLAARTSLLYYLCEFEVYDEYDLFLKFPLGISAFRLASRYLDGYLSGFYALCGHRLCLNVFQSGDIAEAKQAREYLLRYEKTLDLLENMALGNNKLYQAPQSRQKENVALFEKMHLLLDREKELLARCANGNAVLDDDLKKDDDLFKDLYVATMTNYLILDKSVELINGNAWYLPFSGTPIVELHVPYFAPNDEDAKLERVYIDEEALSYVPGYETAKEEDQPAPMESSNIQRDVETSTNPYAGLGQEIYASQSKEPPSDRREVQDADDLEIPEYPKEKRDLVYNSLKDMIDTLTSAPISTQSALLQDAAEEAKAFLKRFGLNDNACSGMIYVFLGMLIASDKALSNKEKELVLAFFNEPDAPDSFIDTILDAYRKVGKAPLLNLFRSMTAEQLKPFSIIALLILGVDDISPREIDLLCFMIGA